MCMIRGCLYQREVRSRMALSLNSKLHVPPCAGNTCMTGAFSMFIWMRYDRDIADSVFKAVSDSEGSGAFECRRYEDRRCRRTVWISGHQLFHENVPGAERMYPCGIPQTGNRNIQNLAGSSYYICNKKVRHIGIFCAKLMYSMKDAVCAG